MCLKLDPIRVVIIKDIYLQIENLLICNHLDIIQFQLTLAEAMVIVASKSNMVALIDCRKKQVRLS